MAKRKGADAVDSDDSDDVSLVDIDFEFFDPDPSVDYLALKRLLVQLFQADSESLQLHELAELILSQSAVGTTVKTDGKESDPYAFLTVLNLHVHKNHPSIQALIAYIIQKSSANPSFLAIIQGLLSPIGLESTNHVGFVFCERLINMPVQVVPPMYRMLLDEVKAASDNNEPYRFSHLIFISRTYRLTPEEEQALQTTAPRSKRQKQVSATHTPPNGIYSFHPEDEYLQKFASFSIDYTFTTSQPREKDAFGLDTGGRMMLVPADRMQELVAVMSEAYTVPS